MWLAGQGVLLFIKASKKNPSAKDAIWSSVLSFCIKHFAEPFLHGSRPMQRCKLSDLRYINVAGALEMHILTALGDPRVELVQFSIGFQTVLWQSFCNFVP